MTDPTKRCEGKTTCLGCPDCLPVPRRIAEIERRLADRVWTPDDLRWLLDRVRVERERSGKAEAAANDLRRDCQSLAERAQAAEGRLAEMREERDSMP